MVLSKGLLIHHIPHLLCMLIVFLTDTLHIELAVEGFFWWESCLFEPFPAIHVLVWVDTFASHQLENLLVLIEPLQIFALIVCLNLIAKFIRLDSINLQLSMNLNSIFFVTGLPSISS